MAKKTELTKREVVVVALHLLGGATRGIDTEHVAMKAFELAPGMFSWKHFADQVDKDLVRVLLFDARKSEFGAHVTGRVSQGWMLTEAGCEFAEAAAKRLGGGAVQQRRQSREDARRVAQERQRLESTDAYQKVRTGHAEQVSEREAEVFFRLNAYITGESRDRKLDQIANMFADDDELSRVIRIVRERVPSHG
ncbi:MAG: hypothetical protein R3F56_04510 [Planctomycetota bacterium]